MTPVPAIEPDDASPPALWEAAKHLAHWFVSLFGEPVAVAALGVLAPRERAEMLDWLRPLEALVRALLVIAAAAVPAIAARAPRQPAKPRPRRMVEQDPKTSESWRVVFRAIPSVSRAHSKATRTNSDLPNAWPIAERLEAVIRVLENPAPYARRLAARLRAEPEQTARILRPPPRSRRTGPADWALSNARAEAGRVAVRFDTS